MTGPGSSFNFDHVATGSLHYISSALSAPLIFVSSSYSGRGIGGVVGETTGTTPAATTTAPVTTTTTTASAPTTTTTTTQADASVTTPSIPPSSQP